MAHQAGSDPTTGKNAPGDAPNTGAPGPTPAPTYKNPSLAPRDFTPGYGTNRYMGASSDTPGKTTTSPLADDLRRQAAKSDAGDLLGEIISKGTGRSNKTADLMSPQTHTVSAEPYPAARGMRSRTSDDGSPGGVVPSHCGTPVFDPTSIRKPGA